MQAVVTLALLTALVAVPQATGLHLRPARQATNSCDSATDKCVLLTSCPKIQKLLLPATRKSVQRVEQLVCGTQNMRTMVCCPTDRTMVEAPVPSQPAATNSCDSATDKCVLLNSCPEVQKLVRPATKEGYQRLKKLVCGTQNTRTLVCCPADRPMDEKPDTIATRTTTSSGEALLPISCGHALPGDKIIGGTRAYLGAYPWMAVLGFKGNLSDPLKWGCGGSLINDRYVLTAAHCTTRLLDNMTLTTVRLGENNLETLEDCKGVGQRRTCAPAPLDFGPAEIVHHPDYGTRGYLSDDVSLIRLDRAAPFTPFIQPVCLPAPGEIFTGIVGNQEPVVIGFGDTEIGQRSLQLLQVMLPVVPREQCLTLANYKTILVPGPGQVCLGGKLQQDSCFKDSGGPAMVTKTLYAPPYVQVGIVSYGTQSCGRGLVPAVYTDVAHYRRWIVDNLRA